MLSKVGNLVVRMLEWCAGVAFGAVVPTVVPTVTS